MTYFLLVIIIILCIIIYFQYNSKRTRDNNITYIYQKLEGILSNGTSEKLLVFTDDQSLIPLLAQINNLLNYNQKILADHGKTEASMKKMLSNISHDLKTPLTVIMGYLETIQLEASLSDEIKREIHKVHAKAEELLKLINNFFDLAKLESGDEEIQLARININEVCRKNMLAFYDTLTKKGIDVLIEIPKNNIYVFGNEEALDRILNNLLSNAIMYGGDGNVVGLTLSSDDTFAYIDVWDKGKGIDEINKERVFERLYKLEDSRNKRYQSSGLGLTITKRLVEKLNGDISLYSKPFEKTVFTIRLKKSLNDW